MIIRKANPISFIQNMFSKMKRELCLIRIFEVVNVVKNKRIEKKKERRKILLNWIFCIVQALKNSFFFLLIQYFFCVQYFMHEFIFS